MGKIHHFHFLRQALANTLDVCSVLIGFSSKIMINIKETLDKWDKTSEGLPKKSFFDALFIYKGWSFQRRSQGNKGQHPFIDNITFSIFWPTYSVDMISRLATYIKALSFIKEGFHSYSCPVCSLKWPFTSFAAVVCTSLLSAGEGGWASNQIFKKGGLDRTSTFRRGCWEREGDFFQGGLQLSHKK